MRLLIDLLLTSCIVPASPPETLSQLQESTEINDSLDHFQSIEVEIPQIIGEMDNSQFEISSIQIEPENFDDIPDMEDFDADNNLIIANDPVSLNLHILYITIFLKFNLIVLVSILLRCYLLSCFKGYS